MWGQYEHLPERLSQVEADLSGIGIEVAGLKEGISRVMSSLSDISKRMSQSDKPQWGVLASWAGIILTILAILGNSVRNDLVTAIDVVNRDNRRLELRLDKFSDGSEQKLSSRVSELRESMRDEMELRNRVLKADISCPKPDPKPNF